MSEWANKYGPLYKVHFLDECVLVCTDPETTARITRRTGAASGRACALRSCGLNQQQITQPPLTVRSRVYTS